MNCQGEPPWRLKIPCWSHQLQCASGPAQSETMLQPSGKPARAADVSCASRFPRQVSWPALELELGLGLGLGLAGQLVPLAATALTAERIVLSL